MKKLFYHRHLGAITSPPGPSAADIPDSPRAAESNQGHPPSRQGGGNGRRRAAYELSSGLLAAAILGMCACSPQGPQLTGTSEQGNAKFTAALYTQTGAPAAGCRVALRRGNYVTNPGAVLNKAQGDSVQTTTDAQGLLRIDSLDSGEYCVEVTDGRANAALLRFSVGAMGRPISWGADTIRRFAVVKGRIDPAPAPVKRFVQVYGLERLVPIEPAGQFVIDNLPQGTFALQVCASDSSLKSPVLDSVSARAGLTTTIPPPSGGWQKRASIVLNTSTSGAGLLENVIGFPVLIRLSAGNFNFTEAQADGRDVRFVKTDGTPQPFEIERWDALLGRAEIWVKLDTVFGNDSGRSMIMLWGNPAAPAQSDAGKVFDTADGYQGVWHLGEDADTLRDATANRYHGIRHGNLTRVPCAAGYGQLFGRTEAYCEMGNVINPGLGGLTASAWVKRANTGLQTIFAKSAGGTPASSYGWSLSFGLADQLHGFLASGGSSWGANGAFDFWSKTDAVVTDTIKWHYIAAVIDRSNGKNCRTYIDGADVTDSGNGAMSAVGALANALPLRIGAEADGDYQWTGSVDECVISRSVRSGAWIRLCYMNQGPVDRLVKINE